MPVTANCNRKNPLVRRGTHQDERRLPALDPGYFGVDERSTADLIQFAARFGRHLNYYSAANALAGDWAPFFTTDIAAILAGLSQLPAPAVQQFGRDLAGWLAADEGRDEGELRDHFLLLFHLPLLLLRDAGDHFDRLPREHPLRAFTLNLLARDAAAPLAELVGYYKGSLALADPPLNDVALLADAAPDPADYNTDFDLLDPRIQLPSAVSERLAGAGAVSALDVNSEFVAGFAPAGWAAFYAGVSPVTAPYEDSIGVAAQAYHQIYDALNYNLLATAVERLFQTLARLAAEAARYLTESLTAFDGHTPHYGLWLAFLRLWRLNQQHLNTLTQRHLDYYYREVLRLYPQAALPDQVHLLIEPAKTVSEALLPAATTAFRAGKDAAGRELLYQLDQDFVVNRARVAQLMALQRPRIGSGGAVLPLASPVANSRDGQGEELPKDDPQWPPFGPPGAATARVGFALADRQLFVREGKRTIAVIVQPDTALALGAFSGGIKASLSAEKGWLDISDPGRLLATTFLGLLVFVIVVEGEDPAIVPYDPAVHGPGYTVTEPILKIELNLAGDQAVAAGLFTALRDLRFQMLRLQVAAEDVRDFTLQNEAGAIDASKSFLPFGAMPQQNASLILGSSELFSKKLSGIVLRVEWEKTLTTTGFFSKTGPSDHQARMHHLAKGKWEPITNDYTIGLFPASGASSDITLGDLAAVSASIAQTLENEFYGPTSRAGFLRLELEAGFGHKAWIDQKTINLINLANDPNWAPPGTAAYNFDGSTKLPKEPYTPKINSISLNYVTQLAQPAHFLHLHPFGFTEENGAAGRLFPELAYEGELYLGIGDLDPPQRVSLLFQAVDGTANPLKGEAALHWHYLRGNAWVELAEQSIDDKTDNLSGTGIVGIAVPEDADTAHTILPAGLHWLRMAAAADSDAVNNMRSIDAQAVAATFLDEGHDPLSVSRPLPAGTIAKLKVANAAVKKVTQPAASFGGRLPENDADFTVRASERLRHKDRASTLWDYERLVLEHFPNVYKVRCINHTELMRDVANNIAADNELKPGHVLVVPIPYVTAGVRDPLRPYTDKKTIVAIDAFLRGRMSPFVQLEVQNPRFEEVQVKFKVAFASGIADIVFYKQELNRAIIRYLSPWAYAEGAEISFGGRWHKSAIIDFVEEQPYVDHLTDFEMYHKADISLAESAWARVDEEVVEATTSRSILVSHPQHIICELAGDGAGCL